MKNNVRKFFGTMAVALAMLATPALAECGPKGSIEQARAAFEQSQKEYPDKKFQIVKLNDQMIASVKEKAGEPPMGDIHEWFVLYANEVAALAITDTEGCIRVTLGPLEVQVINSLIGVREATQ
jgi:predicted small lipoprotein YifL